MMEDLLRWGWLGAIGVNFAIVWVAWSLRRYFVTRTDLADHIKALETMIATHNERMTSALERVGKVERDMDTRLTRVEVQLGAAPTHTDLARVHARLDEIARAMGRLEGVVPGIERLNHLLTQGLLDREAR